MTERRVRELLNEVADAVPPPDVAERAWRGSVRVRRRRVAGTALVAVGVVVAVVGLTGVIGDAADPGARQSDLAGPAPVPEAAKPRPADARVAGAPTWIGPTLEEEAELPRVDSSVLPGTVDLATNVEIDPSPGPAVAAFATSGVDRLESVLLLGRDGQVTRLETPGLGEVVNYDNGKSVLPLNISSLSPDGTKLVLAQQDRVVLYDLVTGGDPQEFDTTGYDSWYVGWTSDGQSIQLVEDYIDLKMEKVVNVNLPSGGGESAEDASMFPVDTFYWPYRTDGARVAQAGLGESIPTLGDSGVDPVLVTVEGPRPALLVVPTVDGDREVSPCCRVVDWLRGDVVAFQSQTNGTYRVLGWDTNSGAVRLVSEAELPDDWDDGVTASWADLAR